METMLKLIIYEERSIQKGVDSQQIWGSNNKQSVLKIEITDFITGINRPMYTQKEIVAVAAESNLRRQSKTIGTVFCQPALFNAFGLYVDNQEKCLGVLEGSFITHKDADPFAVSLLEAMVQPKSLKETGPTNLIPTPVENSDTWHTQKDKTGVFSWCTDQRSSEMLCLWPSPQRYWLYDALNTLGILFHASRLVLIVSLEILKKAGCLNIDKMRLIQLIHPEYQTNNTNVGRKVLVNAEIYNEVAEE